jgi:hypothetical protein
VAVTLTDYDDIIRRIVDAAPPLSQAQRDQLATLLDGDEGAVSAAA